MSCPRCYGQGYIFDEAIGDWRRCPRCQAVEKEEGREKGRKARDSSVRQVREHNPFSYEELVSCGRKVVVTNFDLTGDDIRDAAGMDLSIREPRVMGPVMKRLQAEGLIEPTDEYRQGHRGVNHARPQRVWKSRVYRP